MKDYMDTCSHEMQIDKDCDCNDTDDMCVYMGISPLPEKTVVAMAYIPFQTDTTMYDIETAFKNGTAYPVLNKPFLGGRCI